MIGYELMDPECRECGCSDFDACVTAAGVCWWIKSDLCSACYYAVPDNQITATG